MTTLDNPANLVFDNGGANEITIYTSNVEEIKTKILRLVKIPKSKANRASGPNATKVLDLLRVEHRFTIRGLMDVSDKTDLDVLFDKGGPVNMLWETVTYSVNIEKYAYIKKDNENSERDITITLVVGGDL